MSDKIAALPQEILFRQRQTCHRRCQHQQHRQQNRKDRDREGRRDFRLCFGRHLFGRDAKAQRHAVAHEFSKQRAGHGGRRQADQQRVEDCFAHVRFAGRLVEYPHRRNRPWMRRHQTVHNRQTRNQRNAQSQ